MRLFLADPPAPRAQSPKRACPAEEASNTSTHSPLSGQTTPAASSPSEAGGSRGHFFEQNFSTGTLERRLLRAVADDDIVLVKALVAGEGLTKATLEQALACAADHNAWKTAAYLVSEGGVDINALCDGLGTALHHAVAANAGETVQVLTDAGCSPSVQNERGVEPSALLREADRHSRREADKPTIREMIEAFEKRYALCMLRYVAWGLSEHRTGSVDARFRSRVEAGQPLPRLAVRKVNEADPDEQIAVIKEMIIGVPEDAFDSVISMLDVCLPLPSPMAMEPLEHNLLLREDESRQTSVDSTGAGDRRLHAESLLAALHENRANLTTGEEGKEDNHREGDAAGRSSLDNEFALEDAPAEAVVESEEVVDGSVQAAVVPVAPAPTKVSIGVQTPTHWPEPGEEEEEEEEENHIGHAGAIAQGRTDLAVALASEAVDAADEVEPTEVAELTTEEAQEEEEEEQVAELEAPTAIEEGEEGIDEAQALTGEEGVAAGEEGETVPLLTATDGSNRDAERGCWSLFMPGAEAGDRQRGCACALSEGLLNFLSLLGFK